MARDRRRSHACTIAAVVLTTAAGLALLAGAAAPASSTAQPAPAATSRAANPHWSPSGCGDCHRTDTPANERWTPAEIEVLCSGCHNGRRAPREVHPSLRPAVGPQLHVPPEWPRADGRIGCATCHDMPVACTQPAAKAAGNAAFLRDYDPAAPTALCARCHEREPRRFNPHRMLDAHGRPDATACRYCHVDVPSELPTREDALRVAALRTDAATLCMGCHPRHVEWAPHSHVGAVVPDAIRRDIERCTAASRPHGPPSSPTTQPARGRAERLVLPLDGAGRVQCATCHNPHERGVFPDDAMVGWGGQTFGPGHARLALRGFGSQVCSVCHARGATVEPTRAATPTARGQ